MPDEPKVTITLTFTQTVAERLAALADPSLGTRMGAEHALYRLADHAQQAVYRSGAWEREWICQALGYDWLANLEPDPEHADIGWQRPRKSRPRLRDTGEGSGDD